MGSTGSAGTPAWCHAGPTLPSRRAFGGRRLEGSGHPGRSAAGRAPLGHTPVPPRSGDGDVAFPVGAVHLHAVLPEPAERLGRGVAVGVVGADGDQGDPRLARRQEVWVGVGAPVVRHLEHVGPQVHPGAEDARLGLGAQVAGEQHRHPVGGGPYDHRQVVRRRGRRRPCRVGRQHLQREPADGPPIPGHERGALGAGIADEAVQPTDPVIGGRQGRCGHDPHLPAVQRPGQAPGVIGVEVREQDHRQGVDAEPGQAPVDGRDVGAGVHQHAGAGTRRQDEGVPRPDVAGDRDRP